MNKIKTKRLLSDMKMVKTSPIPDIWIEWENDGDNLEKAFSIVCGPIYISR